MDPEIFLKAAEIMMKSSPGCCNAISNALGGECSYTTPYHKFFETLFPWSYRNTTQFDRNERVEHWYGEHEARVLALLFCYWEATCERAT